MKLKTVLCAIVLCTDLTVTAFAQQVGDIQVVYFAPSTFDISGPGSPPIGILDAPAFVIENTSNTAIDGGILSIEVGPGNGTADSFHVGTIAAHSYATVVPGLSNDGSAGHTFFALTRSALDTSDVGPNDDQVPFEFTGMQGRLSVDSGIFTPATSKTPANDHTVASMNFLGGPSNSDGPCNDCYGPKIVATLDIQRSVVPELASLPLLMAGMALPGLYVFRRRRG